jgi:hypothetical protein
LILKTILKEEDLRKLVRGEILVEKLHNEHGQPGVVIEIALQDIGYHKMAEIIIDEINSFKNKKTLDKQQDK